MSQTSAERADELDRYAGLAWRSGDTKIARYLIARARAADPGRALWAQRDAAITAAEAKHAQPVPQASRTPSWDAGQPRVPRPGACPGCGTAQLTHGRTLCQACGAARLIHAREAEAGQ